MDDLDLWAGPFLGAGGLQWIDADAGVWTWRDGEIYYDPPTAAAP